MAISLVEQTYNRLVEMIIKKEYKPGERLPSEMILCEQLEVSRNTLRAALNKMGVLGFTETRQGGGTYVKAVDSDMYLNFFVPALLTHNINLLEVMRFRKGIEVEAARLAAEAATSENITILEEMLNQCRKKAGEEDMPEFASANMDFHMMIAQLSGSKMLEKIMEIIKAMILPEMQNFLAAQEKDIDSNFYHEMILLCITNHKAEEAAYFMDRHMELVVERVKQYVMSDGQINFKKGEKTDEKNLGFNDSGSVGVDGLRG